MRGQQQSGSRRLNHHWQSGKSGTRFQNYFTYNEETITTETSEFIARWYFPIVRVRNMTTTDNIMTGSVKFSFPAQTIHVNVNGTDPSLLIDDFSDDDPIPVRTLIFFKGNTQAGTADATNYAGKIRFLSWDKAFSATCDDNHVVTIPAQTLTATVSLNSDLSAHFIEQGYNGFQCGLAIEPAISESTGYIYFRGDVNIT